ncbi:MAG: ABC-2 transporter permease [Lachnospiraceae bacterium]|nr:ABC-2 transporter permease [Lachnospiraceae bacterium]
MKGLLYKDFVAIRGKRFCTILLVLTAVMFLTRIIFSDFVLGNAGYVTIDEERVFLPDYIVLYFPAFFSILVAGFFSKYLMESVRCDEQSRRRGYLASLPVSKREYVASKYVLMGILLYVLYSLSMVWSICVGGLAVQTDRIRDVIHLIEYMSLVLFVFLLFAAAIELPLLLLLGAEKVHMVEVGFFLTLGLLVVWYALFGDLGVISRLDFDRIMDAAERHSFELMAIGTGSPILVLVLYYLSFRLTTALYERKEDVYDS